MLDLVLFIVTLVLYEVTRNSDPGFIPKLAPGTLVCLLLSVTAAALRPDLEFRILRNKLRLHYLSARHATYVFRSKYSPKPTLTHVNTELEISPIEALQKMRQMRIQVSHILLYA